MNEYVGQYHDDNGWIDFCIKADHIEEALDWTKKNIQERGIMVAQIIPDYFGKEEEEESLWAGGQNQ